MSKDDKIFFGIFVVVCQYLVILAAWNNHLFLTIYLTILFAASIWLSYHAAKMLRGK